MGVNAAEYLMNQATFHSIFPILVITKIFAYVDIWNIYESFEFYYNRNLSHVRFFFYILRNLTEKERKYAFEKVLESRKL